MELRLPPEPKKKKFIPWNKGMNMREHYGEVKFKRRYKKTFENLNRSGNPNLPGANKKEILQIEDGKIVAVFESSVHAAQSLHLHASNIRRVCRGERKQTGGKHFYYAENESTYIHLLEK